MVKTVLFVLLITLIIYYGSGALLLLVALLSSTSDQVTGGGGKTKPGNLKFLAINYDEYDDSNLYEKPIRDIDYFDNIVVDGHNMIHYLINKKYEKPIKNEGDYLAMKKDAHFISTMDYVEMLNKVIQILQKLFKKKRIFMVIKNPSNDYQLKEFLRITKAKTLDQYFKDLSTKYDINIIVAEGDAKARDDYAAIYLTELLDNSILLSRDRFSDIDKTLKLQDIIYKVYGDNSEEYERRFKSVGYPNIGRWTFSHKLIGYSFVKDYPTNIYEKKIHKESLSSKKVLLISENDL